MAYATAFQSAQRQRQKASAAAGWRIRTRSPGASSTPKGTLLGNASPWVPTGVTPTFGTGYGRTLLGAP